MRDHKKQHNDYNISDDLVAALMIEIIDIIAEIEGA